MLWMVEGHVDKAGGRLDAGEVVSRGDAERDRGDLGRNVACASYASPEDLELVA